MSSFPGFLSSFQYFLWILIIAFLFTGCESKRVKRADPRFLDSNTLGEDPVFECDSDDPALCECDHAEFGFPHCEPCDCYYGGTVPKVCDEVTGECECLPNFGEESCDKCALGYYALPGCNNTCNCSEFGSLNTTCDRTTGVCPCKPNFAGDKCDECAIGYEHYPKCEMNCDPPEDMVRVVKNSKYLVRFDLGPVPDKSLPHHYLSVKNYCEALKLKLPTIQHRMDYISFQEYVLIIARAAPKRYIPGDDMYLKTEKMVYLDIKYHASDKKFHSQQNLSAPVYLYWDYYAPWLPSKALQPHWGGATTTRVVANAIRYFQKWNNAETKCDEWKKHWMGIYAENEATLATFAPVVACQFPEGSECFRKSFEEKQNQKEVELEQQKQEWKGADILGWINGHLVWVAKHPGTWVEQINHCQMDMRGQPLFLELVGGTATWFLQHNVTGGANQTNLKMLRDYYVCRHLKNDIQPLPQMWFRSCDWCTPYDTFNHYQFTLMDYKINSKVKERSYTLPQEKYDHLRMNGINMLCYCQESKCKWKYPKDKNACNSN